MNVSDFSAAKQKRDAQRHPMLSAEENAKRLLRAGFTSDGLEWLLLLTNDQIRLLRDVLSDVIAAAESTDS